MLMTYFIENTTEMAYIIITVLFICKFSLLFLFKILSL